MMHLIEQCLRYLLILAAFCLFSFAAIIYSGSANQWITTHLTTFLNEATNIPVTIQNARIEFPLKISADNIVLGSPTTPYLKADQVNIDWNIQELLRGKFVVDHLDVESLILHSTPPAETKPQSPPTSMPGFAINAIHIHRFQLSEKTQNIQSEIQRLKASVWEIQGSCLIDEQGAIKTAFHIEKADRQLVMKGTVYGSLDNFELKTNFQTSQLEYNNIPLSDTKGSLFVKKNPQRSIGNVSATSSFQGIEATVSSDFIYASNHIHFSKIFIETPQGNGKGDVTFSLDKQWIEGKIQADLDFNAMSNLNLNGKGTIAIQFQDDAASPIVMDFISPKLGSNDVSLEDVHVEATLFDLFNEPQILAHTSIKNLSFTQFPSEGSISCQGSLEGSLSAPTGILNLELSKMISSDERWSHQPPLNGKIQFNLAKNQLDYHGLITSSTIPELSFEGDIPCSLSIIPFQATIDRQKEMNGHFTLQGELAHTLQLFFPDFTMFSGVLSAKGKLFGSLDAPHHHITAEIKQGVFEVSASGTVLKNIDALLESDENTAKLISLQATDKENGTVIGSGSMELNAQENYPFSIHFDVTNSILWQQDYTSAAFTGQITFEGNTLEGKLIGDTTCTNAEIVIPDRTDALIDTVEVTYINQPEGMTPPPALITPATWPLAFDIAIVAPETISITGQELDSVWKGKLTISGDTNLPLLFGEFRIVEGYYMFNGKNFFIDQGMISLGGEVDKKTTLYVIAAKDLGKVKVEVILKGSVKNPEISFRSNPPLPQREILSWILFNRGTSEISHFQGSQLRESITNLSGTHKGPDVLTKIRDALGIDRIEICKGGPGDNSPMGVQVGKYISQNVYVSVNKSDVNRVAVEATLMENIKLEADIGDDSEGNLILKWKRDY